MDSDFRSLATRLTVGTLLVLTSGACGHVSDPRRFALRAPVLRDQDLDAVTIQCRGEKKKCGPQPYESSFAWDAADNTIFRPVSDTLILKSRGKARNINAFDEVADSSWFVNRIGTHAMTDKQVFDGYCKPGKTLDPSLPDGAWLIDHGKDNGANPGFRVLSEGTKYMFKTDESQGERATAATAIASRFYFAAGWWAPCDAIVYFRRSILKLKPGLTIKANTGAAKTFDDALLDAILSKASRRGDKYRVAASRWLPGKALGPFTYDGVRDDDPSDVIPHEHRRDLRGARVMAAWLNHFDAREQNSMSTWMEEEDLAKERATESREAPAKKSGDHGTAEPSGPMKGHIRHWYIDLGDSFGSEWTVDGFSRRHGHSYILDFPYLVEDFLTLGIPERPWDRARRPPEAPIFGYFSERDFNPDVWRNEYPNSTFTNLEEDDGAWAARIIARFEPRHVAAAIGAGDLTEPAHRDFLLRVLLARQKTILHRYFSKLSPVTDVTTDKGRLCAVDLARKTRTWTEDSFRYGALIVRGTQKAEVGIMSPEPDGRVCLALANTAPNDGVPDDSAQRYVVVRIANGVAPGPLVLHLYDLGPQRGFTLVGIERPEH